MVVLKLAIAPAGTVTLSTEATQPPSPGSVT